MKKQNGFTLVELSIVLVIIGLLVGGILVSQSLIESTKLNSQIRQIQSYDIAIAQFKSKYKSIPGDSKLFSIGGNGDGIIQNGGGSNDDVFGGESSYFWPHLTQAGMLGSNENYVQAGVGITAEVNVPKAVSVEGKNIGIIAGVCTDGCGAYTNINSYWISSFPTTTRNTWGGSCSWSFNASTNTFNETSLCRPAFSPSFVAALDKKIDDGAPATGGIIGAAWNEWDTLPAVATQGTALACHNGTRYWSEDTNPHCSIKIKLLHFHSGM